MDYLLDPLFRLPFAVGLLLAPTLALLGAYLRLRGEWLATLGYAQVAAAGGVLSLLLHWPVLLTAVAAALAVIGLKAVLPRPGNDFFAVLIVAGWASSLLLASASPHGEMVARALSDGQLYFSGAAHLATAAALVALVAALLPWLSRRLVMARLFPDHYRANGIPSWHYGLPFDLLVVVAVAVGTAALGVMATFALIFVPAWVAFRLAVGWRRVLLLSALLATLAYLAAFVLALVLDQPFGPVLAALLALLALLRLVRPRPTAAEVAVRAPRGN